MRLLLRPLTGPVVAGSLLLCACGGTESSGLTTLDSLPPSTAVPPTTAAITTTSTVMTTTSESAAGSTSSLPDGFVGLSPDGPWRLVDSAPGVEAPGLVYELLAKLWVWLPVEESEEWGISWTLTEDDRPIIEAYLQARLVFFEAATSSPIDLDSPGWERWFSDAEPFYRTDLGERRLQGQVADLDMGVVLRPQVIGDERTTSAAIVFDCVLDGGVFRLANGELAPGSTPGVTPTGIGVRMVVMDGSWKLAEVGGQVEACA